MDVKLSEVAALAVKIVAAVEPLLPVAGGLVPTAAPALEIADKVIKAFLIGEPTAVSLVKRISSGEDVTAVELLKDIDINNAEYQALSADLKQQIADLA